MAKRKMTRRRGDTRNRAASGDAKPPESGEWIYGWHAVLAALRNPRRGSGRLIATAEAVRRIRAEVPAATPETLDRAELDALLPDSAVHQGIALLAPALDPIAIEDLVAETKQNAIIVVLDQVTDPHNVGAVLRSAAVFGAIGVVVQDRSAPPAAGALTKAASGALDVVPLVRVTNLARALEQIANAGFWRIGFDGTADSTLATAPYEGRTALILGSEGDGMRRLTRENCDLLVRIEAPGALQTLNVSNAAAIALYETVRRVETKK
jgi:23S rRNA (guanosine2251-2'-O)-methyltransferase